jgi:predicted amidohydrolase YtcJ
MADLFFENGVLLTQEAARPLAEALAVRDGRIAAVGSREDLVSLSRAGTRRVDLAGRTLVPGFNDAHAHVWKIGQLLTQILDLRGVESLAALQKMVREAAARLPQGAWVLGRGYNEAQMREGRQPERRDLDEAVSERPVYLTRTCGHIGVANSRALAVAGVGPSTAAPSGGVIERDERGEPTGVLHETAVGLVSRKLPQPTEADYAAMVRAATRHQLERGITSTADCGVLPELLSAYLAMDQRRELSHRLNVMPLRRPDGSTDNLPLPERYLSDHLRVDTVKLFADGGLSGATAALSRPYRHSGSHGVLRFEEEELRELVEESEAAGFRVAVHAIGDRALDQVLSVYEAVAGERRRRIEHFALPDEEMLARAAGLRIVAVPQPVFLYDLSRNFRQYLPERFLRRAYPLRSMLDAGLALALSSDAPVVSEDHPLRGIQAAICRGTGESEPIALEQGIPAAEALYAYTRGGAVASGDEGNRGSLAVGKWADLVVLSDNPLVVEPEALTEIRVEMTFVGGELVYER